MNNQLIPQVPAAIHSSASSSQKLKRQPRTRRRRIVHHHLDAIISKELLCSKARRMGKQVIVDHEHQKCPWQCLLQNARAKAFY
jgi:hypothetical protein